MLLDQFEKKINYKFNNQDLLIEALTHSSSSISISQNYERLEFLGDSVLGLVVSESLLLASIL